MFVVSGPHGGGSRILLRFYVLQRQKRAFARAQVVCNQKDLQFERRLGVLVDSAHGVSIKLAGSVNFMAMYSASSSKVWVFAVRMVGDDYGDGVVVKLMRCAVIECCKPLFGISVSFGFLVLGEENGVRAFDLRQLLKGKGSKAKQSSQSNSKSEGRKLSLPNGVVGADVQSDRSGKCDVVEGTSELTCHCYLDGKKQRNFVFGKYPSCICCVWLHFMYFFIYYKTNCQCLVFVCSLYFNSLVTLDSGTLLSLPFGNANVIYRKFVDNADFERLK